MTLTPRIDTIEQRVSFNEAGPNMIINGGMDFWQRSTSAAGVTGGGYFAADRWRFSEISSAVFTLSQDSSVPTQSESGFASSYSQKIEVTTADAAPTQCHIRQVVEGYNIADLLGDDITFSFWVRSSLVGTYSVCFRNNDGTRTYLAEYTIDSANVWERKTITLDFENTGTWALDNTGGLNVQFVLAATGARASATIGSWFDGSSGPVEGSVNNVNFLETIGNTIQFAQVSLNKGSVAPQSFKRAGRNIGDEFSMCQRYYKVFDTSTNYPIPIGEFGRFDATTIRVNFSDVVNNMNRPDADFYASVGSISIRHCGDGSSAGTFPTSGTLSSPGGRVNLTGLSGVIPGSYFLYAPVTGSISFDAEL